jgi:diguanylate cyclase (GGDEF)-like protein/PAS domain S-box-containing protein
MHEGVYIANKDHVITFWNDAAEKITGYSKKEIIGYKCDEAPIKHFNERGEFLSDNGCHIIETIKNQKNVNLNVYIGHKDGEKVPVSIRTVPVYGKSQEIEGALEVFADISRDFKTIKSLEQSRGKNFIDPVTYCANKEFAELEMYKRFNEWKTVSIPFALCIININNLFDIREKYGEEIMKKVIAMTSRSAISALSPIDYLCRWSHSQLIAIIPNVDEYNTKKMCERLKMLIENSWIDLNKNARLESDTAIGCSLIQDNENIIDLLFRAEKATTESIKRGKNAITII